MSFQSTKSDNSLFVKINRNIAIYILIYVVLIITGDNDTQISNIIQFLNNQFSIKDPGYLNYFLRIEVTRKLDTEITLSQRKHIIELLIRPKMEGEIPQPTPMIINQHLSKNRGVAILNDKRYRNLVGAIQYVTITGPDISFGVNKVCQFIQQPLDEHWKTVKGILKY